jgi:hypothetical protein
MPFFKTFTLSETLHHIKFPFSPLISCRRHGKKREKYGQAFPFSKPLQQVKPCLIFNFLFPRDTYRVQESWKEERKILSGIPFSKPSQSVTPCLLFSFLFFP